MSHSENKETDNVTKLNQDEVTSTFESLSEQELKDEELYNKRRKEYEEVLAQKRKLYYMLMTFSVCFFVLVITSIMNQGLYRIDEETLSTIKIAYNALILLMIPFLLGALGAFTRVLISGLKVANSTTLIIASGLMAVFSWIGIKSGILVSIIAPHLEKQGVKIEASINVSHTEFYTMALVAILVGMFSSNVYIFINQKVEQLTKEKK
ncbi:hypothetical protein KIJ96_00425 [Pseudoalteromonas piscicida]|uniref:hypothetical protein n=1 Tax=Pseudoalteromonas piscicida TaxID=43662 RepID=UPI001D09AC4E|nr:hypothetical protein [Pseudoalteromonas piscicida]UDM61776.1 hypothetical protein KIJ96_00425 [Pseudoalteromonas piscicida]